MGRKGTAANTGATDQATFWEYWGRTLIFSSLVLAATGAFLLAAPFLPDTDPANVRADWLALACLITGLFTANIARMLQIWGRLSPALTKPAIKRLPDDQTLVRLGFRELFYWLILSLAALTAVAYVSTSQNSHPWPELNLVDAARSANDPLPIYTFLGILALAFLPVSGATYLQARAELKHRPSELGKPAKLFRDDAVSPASFWISFILVVAIVILANWAAGAKDTGSALSGVLTFWITFIVIALFVGFIFVPHISRFFLGQKERRDAQVRILAGGAPPLYAPARFASWLDSGLVRLIAPLSGATQKGVPHLLVILIMLPLTALGFALATPWGLAPIAIGMLLVAGLGRRWAWVEEDRETASRLLKTDAREIQIGFDNDLKDEALLGYAFLFVLVPLSLHQLWGWQRDAFVPVEGADVSNAFVAWLSFFGAELAKAVPFVDWWEIYQVDLKRPIEPSETNALGKHLTFLSRAMVDLVIMAALFQAISIWQRNRTQQRLYDAGQIDVFDPFLEEQFFSEGMQAAGNTYRPSLKFEERVQRHLERRSVLGLPETPYNERRLTDLLDHPEEKVRAGAEWMVTMFDVIVGKPPRKLELLADRWDASWTVTLRTNGSVTREYMHINPEWRRLQKPRIEAVLEELLGPDRETIPKTLSDIDILNLMRLLRHCGDYAEFHYVRTEIVELLAQATAPLAFWALVAQTCPPRENKFARWISEIRQRLGTTVTTEENAYAPPYFGMQDDRALCYRAIAEHAMAYEDLSSLPCEVCEYLNLMRKIEAKTRARPAAEEAYKGIGCNSSKTCDPLLPQEAEALEIDDEELVT
ncbi:MAG: hypothetical protein CVT79_07350 [Alphaproteobacteria bacterium HGW-Alphaproteobacteria-18]|nr:MAG: hypothetical protein CVT79_07350 [Alphaproteobacteria bacterium HGW-Alphaproteobacteria-18]